MGAQPGLHRLLPVVLDGLGQVGGAHRAGDHGGELVLRGDQGADPVQLLAGRQRVEILGGERVQGRQQLAHDTSHAFDQVFEVYRCEHALHYLNPQVRGLSTDSHAALDSRRSGNERRRVDRRPQLGMAPAWLPRSATLSSSTSCAGSTGCSPPWWGGSAVQRSAPLAGRDQWWAVQVPVVAAGVAAAPRFLGRLADLLPLQNTVGTAVQSLVVLGVAAEHDVEAPAERVSLLARVLLAGTSRPNVSSRCSPARAEPTGRTRWVAPASAAPCARSGAPPGCSAASTTPSTRGRRAGCTTGSWPTCRSWAWSAATPPSARGCGRRQSRPPHSSTRRVSG